MQFPKPPPLKPKLERPDFGFLPTDPKTRRLYKMAIFYTQIFWCALFVLIGAVALLALRVIWPDLLSLKTALLILVGWSILGSYFGYFAGFHYIRTGWLQKTFREKTKA